MFAIDATTRRRCMPSSSGRSAWRSRRGGWGRGTGCRRSGRLAVDLRVNANTVAKVYGELERAGVLETRRGVGTFVRAAGGRGATSADRERTAGGGWRTDSWPRPRRLGFSAEEAIDFLKQRLDVKGRVRWLVNPSQSAERRSARPTADPPRINVVAAFSCSAAWHRRGP